MCMYVCVEKRYADKILVKVPVEKLFREAFVLFSEMIKSGTLLSPLVGSMFCSKPMLPWQYLHPHIELKHI